MFAAFLESDAQCGAEALELIDNCEFPGKNQSSVVVAGTGGGPDYFVRESLLSRVFLTRQADRLPGVDHVLSARVISVIAVTLGLADVRRAHIDAKWQTTTRALVFHWRWGNSWAVLADLGRFPELVVDSIRVRIFKK